MTLAEVPVCESSRLREARPYPYSRIDRKGTGYAQSTSSWHTLTSQRAQFGAKRSKPDKRKPIDISFHDPSKHLVFIRNEM
jgi:hypothetical protein